jgi:hypothetical protein
MPFREIAATSATPARLEHMWLASYSVKSVSTRIADAVGDGGRGHRRSDGFPDSAKDVSDMSDGLQRASKPLPLLATLGVGSEPSVILPLEHSIGPKACPCLRWSITRTDWPWTDCT